MEWLAMDEQDQWLTLYLILVFVAFIPGLALLAALSVQKEQRIRAMARAACRR
jgi:hypothetical protein